jgi:hypothetical protein
MNQRLLATPVFEQDGFAVSGDVYPMIALHCIVCTRVARDAELGRLLIDEYIRFPDSAA